MSARRVLPFVGNPDTNPEMRPFWAACAERRLLLRRCRACGAAHWYPRAQCPFCFSDDGEWIEAGGRGSIYTFSVVHAPVPYVLAYVTLEEGISMLTNIVDCDFAALRIGQAVAVRFEPSEGGPPLPVFAPVEAPPRKDR